jgi:hypothetical protein
MRHFGFAELRHFRFAPTGFVGARLLAPDRNDRVIRPLEMSVYVVAAVRWECVKSPFLGDFQGLWEEGETGQVSSSCLPRFPSDRHFHRFLR